jgi:hypothetical protein
VEARLELLSLFFAGVVLPSSIWSAMISGGTAEAGSWGGMTGDAGCVLQSTGGDNC